MEQPPSYDKLRSDKLGYVIHLTQPYLIKVMWRQKKEWVRFLHMIPCLGV